MGFLLELYWIFKPNWKELTSWQYWVFLSMNLEHLFIYLVLLWCLSSKLHIFPYIGLVHIFFSVQLLSSVRLFVTPWTEARQASLSITNSRSLLKLMSIKSVMPSNYLNLCRPLLLLPSIFPSVRVFSFLFLFFGCLWKLYP